MAWLGDPQIWASLLTLTALEIVLGIDNLIFIAILANRLPPDRQDGARKLGLALALITRLALLASISWIVGLTQPLFELLGHAVSWRDIILISGGFFLLYKATREIHERIEGEEEERGAESKQVGFASTIAQIMVLDAVFSLDSVITAVGMANELWVMATAVILAVLIMLTSSGVVSTFINQHPTVKMLALSFLLLIGMTLIADGAGFHVPKGYVYAAIIFSVGVEALNQFAARRRRSRASVTSHDDRKQTQLHTEATEGRPDAESNKLETGPHTARDQQAQLEHGPKKLTDFFDKNML
jgi:predicted tellurium resistance membrane protein TerC